MSPLENTFRVAIFDQFLESFALIPRAEQKKVNGFIRKFRADPTSRAINYEKISSFIDPNLRTVRIGDAYRAIVLKPEQGNVYVLLWVDHHDEAMAWARNKRIEIHPETGGLQVLTLDAAPVAAAQTEAAPPARAPKPKQRVKLPPPLLEEHPDADLAAVGVPEALLPQVRGLRTLDELEALGATFPPEAFEALYWLASGETVEEIQRALDLGEKKRVDTTDFVTALENEVSRRRFVVVENEEELAAMLDAPLEKWRIFLHPTQRKIVEKDWSGPARVTGGAGTGKTVVAMHRAAWLAERVFPNDEDRILFTTYTKNLAADIGENLAKLCPNRTLKRIEVVHLDKWVADFLAHHGYAYEVDYWDAGGGRLWDLWREALVHVPEGAGFPETFYREEWEYVVQPLGCATLDDYIAARRTARGVRLARNQRKAIWPVFAEYRNLLEEKRLREATDAMRDAIGLLDRKEAVSGYRAILVDEAQDMSTTAFTLLRKLVPDRSNDLFIVGDAHQRIYRRQVVLGQAGIKVVGRSRRLRINYRTTDEIRRFAVALLEGLAIDDLDAGLDSVKGYRSLFHGTPPRVIGCDSFEREVEAIAAAVREGDPRHTCLVARTTGRLDQYAAALEHAAIPIHRLSRAKAEDRSAPGLRVATMHRVKGLEFDRIIVAGANDGVIPLAAAMSSSTDPAVLEDLEKQERALLYVALTRARREAILTSSGTPSPWIAPARKAASKAESEVPA